VDGFVKAFKNAASGYYPTLADNPDYTSIINERHYQRLQKLLADAQAAGAKLVEIKPEGEQLTAESRKLAPTIVLGATREMGIMQEEIFGPVLPVIAYEEMDKAIDFINEGERPLAFYYFDGRKSRVEDVLSRTISGGVCINETLMHYPQESLPFGGVGASGMGAYHGHSGFLTFSHARPVFQQSRVHGMGLLAPPYGGLGRSLVKFLIG